MQESGVPRLVKRLSAEAKAPRDAPQATATPQVARSEEWNILQIQNLQEAEPTKNTTPTHALRQRPGLTAYKLPLEPHPLHELPPHILKRPLVSTDVVNHVIYKCLHRSVTTFPCSGDLCWL
jgi:hypothetical protein